MKTTTKTHSNMTTTATKVHHLGLRSALAITLGAAALAHPMALQAEEAEPILNSTFEQSTNNHPEQWKRVGDWQVLTEDETRFARLVKEGFGNANFLEQTVEIPKGWTNVAVTARVRVSELRGQQQGGFWQAAGQFQNAAGEPVGEGFIVKRNNNTEGWESVKTETTAVPAGAVQVRVVGGIWISEGTLEFASLNLVNEGE